jgi:hypothetical protein
MLHALLLATRLCGHVASGGAPLPGVTITAIAERAKSRYAITNADGDFDVVVPDGDYRIRAELAGFETAEGVGTEIDLLPLPGVSTVTCVLPNYIAVLVTSRGSGVPLQDAQLTLTIDEESSSGLSDAKGKAWTAVGGDDRRAYVLNVKKKGYRAAEIRGVLPGTGFDVRVELEPE